MTTFSPDLIVEATAVCDLACKGCYAANTIDKDQTNLYETRPRLFLNIDKLEDSLAKLKEEKIQSVSIRGGEPTKHPELHLILRKLKEHSHDLYLETHGMWLVHPDVKDHTVILKSIIETDTVIKISFDSMHSLSAHKLETVTNFLEFMKMRFLIAITENSEEDFEKAKSMCAFIDQDKCVFQKKAIHISDLIEPRLGVIQVSGAISQKLSAKKQFLDPRAEREGA